jgi:hypothetical protein
MYATVNKSGQRVDPNEVVNTRSVSNAHTSVYNYYECQRINLTNRVIECEYEENRAVAIIDKPSDYKFAIQRVEASMIDIPMFNSSERTLTVTNTYEPDNIVVTVPIILGVNVEIYNINQVIPAMGAALDSAFNGVKTAYDVIYGPGSWNADVNLPQEPFGVKYDEVEDRFTIYAPLLSSSFYPQGVRLSFSDDLVELFRGNTYDLTNPNRLFFYEGYREVNVVTIDGDQFISNLASYSTSAMWYSMKQIVITSEKLTSRTVTIGGPGLSGAAITRNIILDFNYIPDNQDNAPGTRLNFLATKDRWTDLTGDSPLHSIDFRVYYRDRMEKLIPLTLRPGESFSILCLFAKTVTN